MKNAVITGATGVIGMALIKKCIEEKVPVTVLANPNSTRISRIPDNPLVKIISCGLDGYESLVLDEFGGEGNVFFHLSWGGTFGEARNDIKLQENNLKCTLDAVRLAKRIGCDTFVGVGSQAEYGRVSGILSKDTPTNPENGYGLYKLKAGIESRKLCSELNIRHIWTRVLSIYGPYDGEKTMVISTLRKLLNKEVPALTKGEQMWDFLYCDDAAKAIFLLGENGKDGQIYPIGSGKARPLKDYIMIMRDMVDDNLELGFGQVPYSDKQVMYLCADISNLTEDTGFSPNISFEEGIKRTIDWIGFKGV